VELSICEARSEIPVATSKNRLRSLNSISSTSSEILDQCRVIKKRWKQLSPLGLAPANFRDETVRHPTRRDLRATVSLKQISSAAVARPHFSRRIRKLTQ